MDSDNNKIIKGFAFEKAILEILKKKNSFLKDYELSVKKNQHYIYDAIFFDKLDLSDFGLQTIQAKKIVVEFKSGRVTKAFVDSFLKRTEGLFDAVVFFFANNTPKIIKEQYQRDNRYNVYFVDHDKLIRNDDLRALLSDFDSYIVKEDNLLIEDNYRSLKSNKDKLSFALGAGCSIASNISDWDMLSKALGYELLYSLVDKNDAAFKNMLLSDELNKSIFSCYEKNSALDAIYTYYFTSPSVKKQIIGWQSTKSFICHITVQWMQTIV